MPRKPSMPSSERDWLTTPEVAEAFQVATATVRAWIKNGKLKAYKFNGFNRVDKSELQRFAKEKYDLGDQ
jgi:excisionase family DNA binding protein